MNTRLEQFLAAENISQSQFADTIDVAAQVYLIFSPEETSRAGIFSTTC